jgi:hypothetical protein
LVLIRIEPYFFIAFVITYGIVNVHFVEPEFALTMALIPALAILVVVTIYFTRKENTFGAVIAVVRVPSFPQKPITKLACSFCAWAKWHTS